MKKYLIVAGIICFTIIWSIRRITNVYDKKVYKCSNDLLSNRNAIATWMDYYTNAYKKITTEKYRNVNDLLYQMANLITSADYIKEQLWISQKLLECFRTIPNIYLHNKLLLKSNPYNQVDNYNTEEYLWQTISDNRESLAYVFSKDDVKYKWETIGENHSFLLDKVIYRWEYQWNLITKIIKYMESKGLSLEEPHWTVINDNWFEKVDEKYNSISDTRKSILINRTNLSNYYDWRWAWHEAWYNRAEEKGITDPDDCWGNSNSFIEGCETYANEYRENQCNDWEEEYCE